MNGLKNSLSEAMMPSFTQPLQYFIVESEILKKYFKCREHDQNKGTWAILRGFGY